METLQELNNKQEQVIELNNAIFAELERRGDWNSSHWRIEPFIDSIMDSMYAIQNEYILPYFEALDYILENKLDDAILEYELVKAEIDDFYYQLAEV